MLEYFPDFLRPRFKQLLHHFAVETSASIAHNDSAQAAWCAAIPQLTSSHRFVLQGVIAVSALHLSRYAATDRERQHFHDISAMQMNTGLISYRETVANVTQDNAEALFAFSVTATSYILLTTADECNQLLRSLHVRNQDQKLLGIAIENLIGATSRILRSLRGVLVILVPCWNLIANGIMSAVVKRDWWPPYPVPTSPQAIEEDKKLRELENLWMRPTRRYEYWFDVLRQALKLLREDFARVSQLTVDASSELPSRLVDWSAVMTWPIAIPFSFIELLEQRRPEAWIIFAHYAILPARARHVFWIKDLAPNIVSTAALVIGRKMWEHIRWPAAVVGVNLEILLVTSMAKSLRDETASSASSSASMGSKFS